MITWNRLPHPVQCSTGISHIELTHMLFVEDECFVNTFCLCRLTIIDYVCC